MILIDWIGRLSQGGEVLWGDEHFETARLSRRAAQQAPALQAEQHLVNTRRGDGKEPLQVGLRRWTPIDLRVGMNERQVLPLSFGVPSAMA